MTRRTMGLRMGHHQMAGLLAVGRMVAEDLAVEAGRVAAVAQAAVDQARRS